jgi:hypothetical protein
MNDPSKDEHPDLGKVLLRQSQASRLQTARVKL